MYKPVKLTKKTAWVLISRICPQRNITKEETAPDPHKEFCKRCMAYNRACPLTGRGPSKSCFV